MASLPLIGLLWVQRWCQDQSVRQVHGLLSRSRHPSRHLDWSSMATDGITGSMAWPGAIPTYTGSTQARRPSAAHHVRSHRRCVIPVRLLSRREWALALIPVLLPNDAILYHGCCTGAKIPSYLDTGQRPSQPIRVTRLTSLAPSHLRNPRASSPFLRLARLETPLISWREKGSPYP